MSTESRVAVIPVLSKAKTKVALFLFVAFAFLAATQTLLFGQEQVNTRSKPVVNLTGIKCIVSGVANTDHVHSVEFKQGKIYFSSQRAAKHFEFWTSPKRSASAVWVEREIADLVTKANHQLALTEQYEQKRCPVTGGMADRSNTVRLGGLEIAFETAAVAEVIQDQRSLIHRATAVFADDVFEQAFEPVGETSVMIARSPQRNTETKKK